MSLEFITSAQRWNEIYQELPDFAGKVYYSHAYHAACAGNGDGQPAAVYYHCRPCRIFYPFLIRPVSALIGGTGFADLETAYGYGGPQLFAASAACIAEFKNLFTDWARHNRIVAEFIRFNPLNDWHNEFTDYCSVSHNRITVSVDLQQNFDSMLGQCTPARQRNWRRACRENLCMQNLPDLKAFSELYLQTMQRLAARPYYLFSPAYFAALEAIPSESRHFAGIFTPGGDLAAAAVFLLDTQSAHYHLGASDPAFHDLQANAFLMLEAARRFAGNERRLLHLGGGLSLADDDKLFRFKSGFSPVRQNFYIGRRIHIPEIYEKLSQTWQKLTGCQPLILLHYHYGANNENL